VGLPSDKPPAVSIPDSESAPQARSHRAAASPARTASPIPPGRLAAAAAEMGFVSFVGRVLFVAAFLLSAYQEYAPLPLPAPLFLLSSCSLAVSFRVWFR